MTSLVALLWNFPLIIYNFPLLFFHSKNTRMSTLITIIITCWLPTINYYCNNDYKKSQELLQCSSVWFMESCLSNLLLLIDCFLCNSYPCVVFESFSHVINQESHLYSWNLGKGYLVSLGRFQNFIKVNSVNLSQIPLLNMWLLVLITQVIKIDIASLTVLFCNCPLVKNISVNIKCILAWCD